jgi:hypothetical protein
MYRKFDVTGNLFLHSAFFNESKKKGLGVLFWGKKRKERAPCPTKRPNAGVEVPMPCNGVLRLRRRDVMSGASGGIMLMPFFFYLVACLIGASLIP